MKAIFEEKTEGRVSGTELKLLILEAARVCEEEDKDIEAAMCFYKAAAEVDTTAMYIKETTDAFYDVDSRKEIEA